MRWAVLLLIVVLLTAPASPGGTGEAWAGEARSSKVRRQFLKSLGLTHTPQGCQVDHWVPLMCGGKDELSNLRLICGDYMRRKERIERKCALLPQWKKENLCERNICIRITPKEAPCETF